MNTIQKTLLYAVDLIDNLEESSDIYLASVKKSEMTLQGKASPELVQSISKLGISLADGLGGMKIGSFHKNGVHVRINLTK